MNQARAPTPAPTTTSTTTSTTASTRLSRTRSLQPGRRRPRDRRDPTRSKEASARQFDAETALRRPAHDRVREHDVGEPDAEMRHDDAPGGRPLRPAEDRLAERRRRVRVAIELARVAIGEELLAIVDEEERRLAATTAPSSTSRSRPARRARRVRASPASSPGGRGPNEAAVTTTSAPSTAARAVGRRSSPTPIPSVRRASLGERLGALRVAVEHRELDARQHVPEDREVAVALDARRR